MPIALTVVPVISILGFSALALWPTFATLAVFSVLRRSGNYAIAKPSREVLYTVVTSEERFLTKPFLDVGVYRFGDLLSAWLFEGARVAMAVGISGMALFAVPFCLAWIPVARYLGRRQEEQARER
jgi:AAA family ATP:ADP antiporter